MTEFTRPSTLKLSRSPAPALTSRSRSSTGVSDSAAASRNTVHAATASQDDTASASTTRTVRSETLLQGRSHIAIVHNGETYQLRATRLGKLILTK